jgi:hypothetical protein
MLLRRNYLAIYLAAVGGALLLAGFNFGELNASLSAQLRIVTRHWVCWYDIGLFVLLGLLTGFVASARQWLKQRAPWFERQRYACLFSALLGAGGGSLLLFRDLSNFTTKQELWISPGWLGALLGLGWGLAASLVQNGLHQRPWLRRVGLLGGLLLAYINPRVLTGDYPGIHAIIAVSSLGLLLPWLRWQCLRIHEWFSRVLFTVAFLVGIAPLAVPPTRIVRQNLSVSSGSILAPYIVSWLPQRHYDSTKRLAIERSEWFLPRDHSADIPPSAGEILPTGGAVLLLTVEALRADVVLCRKYDKQLPNLARLRDLAVNFTRARTPTPSTITTATSLLSGKYYSQLYFSEEPSGKVSPVADTSVRLPELLSHASVHTVSVRSVYGLGPDSGVGRGFDASPKTTKDYGPAKELMKLILRELSQLETSEEQRLFLYAHFVDSHSPYTLGGKRKTPLLSYLAEVELIDRELGRLLDFLEEHQLQSRCLLIISADHGEAFGEHGMRYHARSVYEELLRVPLLVSHPNLKPRADATPVTLIDLSPTILDLFGVPTPGSFMGQSLKPLLLGHPVTLSRPIAADSGRRKQALFFPNGMKVIRDLTTDSVQVFNLAQDPRELRDLTDTPQDVEPYIGAMERFFATHTLKIAGWQPPWRSF